MIASIKDFFSQFIEPGIATSTTETPALQVATAALLLEMMRMDNELKDEEHQAITWTLQTQFNLGSEQIETLMVLAEQEAHGANDYYQFTSLINKYCDLPQKVQIIENLWHVAMIDGHLSAHELHLMRKLADLLYIGHADYVAAKQRARESAKLPV
ncbi:MAG: TerB family tellurite resistance protein [Rhodocyclaceae bacterium]|nr:TerB family tellurite resistance protein [Rhodocyclaceae bacterium]MDZ4213909.1 TerB family tellurite resistance protein [Rhodocyclaceae bacterium]